MAGDPRPKLSEALAFDYRSGPIARRTSGGGRDEEHWVGKCVLGDLAVASERTTTIP